VVDPGADHRGIQLLQGSRNRNQRQICRIDLKRSIEPWPALGLARLNAAMYFPLGSTAMNTGSFEFADANGELGTSAKAPVVAFT
jgi:hypothetical protein